MFLILGFQKVFGTIPNSESCRKLAEFGLVDMDEASECGPDGFCTGFVRVSDDGFVEYFDVHDVDLDEPSVSRVSCQEAADWHVNHPYTTSALHLFDRPASSMSISSDDDVLVDESIPGPTNLAFRQATPPSQSLLWPMASFPRNFMSRTAPPNIVALERLVIEQIVPILSSFPFLVETFSESVQAYVEDLVGQIILKSSGNSGQLGFMREWMNSLDYAMSALSNGYAHRAELQSLEWVYWNVFQLDLLLAHESIEGSPTNLAEEYWQWVDIVGLMGDLRNGRNVIPNDVGEMLDNARDMPLDVTTPSSDMSSYLEKYILAIRVPKRPSISVHSQGLDSLVVNVLEQMSVFSKETFHDPSSFAVKYFDLPVAMGIGLVKQLVSQFLELVSDPAEPVYHLFEYTDTESKQYVRPSPGKTDPESLVHYRSVGRVMGIGISRDVQLGMHLSPGACNQLLWPNNRVGRSEILEIFGMESPQIVRQFSGDKMTLFEGIKGFHFFTRENTHRVVENVTDIDEFLLDMARFKMEESIGVQMKHMLLGIYDVLAFPSLGFMNLDEVLKMTGKAQFTNVDSLRESAQFKSEEEDVNPENVSELFENVAPIRWLWEILQYEFSPHELSLFLKYVTGSPYPPIHGFAGDGLVVHFNPQMFARKEDMLPMAHTCFNEIVIGDFSSKEKLAERLRTVMRSYEGVIDSF